MTLIIVFFYYVAQFKTIEECNVKVATYQKNHDAEKSAYAIGNVTFMSNVTLNWILTEYYLLHYSFGDKKDHTEKRISPTLSANHTHNYTTVCDKCSYEVTVIAVSYNSHYCRSKRAKISVISECYVVTGVLIKSLFVF